MPTPNNTRLADYSKIYDLSGILDPSLFATEAAPGTTYKLLRDGSPGFFMKVDEGNTTNWINLGGPGLLGAVNLGVGAQILKSIILGILQLRSISAQANSLIQVTQLANEVQIGTAQSFQEFLLTTVSTSFVTICDLTIPLNFARKYKFEIIARKDDGTGHSYFERTQLFENETGTVVSPKNHWHDSVTLRENLNDDVRYLIIGNVVRVQVKAATSDITYWKAHVNGMSLNTI
jgi:hypothetical protein